MNLRSIALACAASAVLFAGAANARTVYFNATYVGHGETREAASEAAKQAAVNRCRNEGGTVAGSPTARFSQAYGTNQAGPDTVIVGYDYFGSVRCAKEVPDDDVGPQFGDI